jgi:formyltetrahydrofolate synthetase
VQDKIEIIAKEMYKASGVSYSPEAEAQVSQQGG